MERIIESIQRLDDGPHMVMVDLNEHRSSKEMIFLVFDTIRMIVVETLHLEPVRKGKQFL